MSLELTGVHGLLKRHKLFTHKIYCSSLQNAVHSLYTVPKIGIFIQLSTCLINSLFPTRRRP